MKYNLKLRMDMRRKVLTSIRLDDFGYYCYLYDDFTTKCTNKQLIHRSLFVNISNFDVIK